MGFSQMHRATSIFLQRYHCRSPAAGFRRGIFKGQDYGVFFQDRSDDLTLDAFAATVDNADFIEAGPPTLFEILLYHAGNILWRKSVKIDGFLNRNDDRLAKGRIYVRIARRIL